MRPYGHRPTTGPDKADLLADGAPSRRAKIRARNRAAARRAQHKAARRAAAKETRS